MRHLATTLVPGMISLAVGSAMWWAIPAPALAQDAGAILQTALERYEQRVQGIDDYTVTVSLMGQEATTYLEKRMVEGHPVFLPADGEAGAADGWNPWRLVPRLAERAEHVGTETVGGVEAHGIRVEDLEGLDLGTPAQLQGEFRPRTLTLWIDAGQSLVRRMEVDGVMVTEGEKRPLTMTVTLEDYRTVEGMPHPWRTRIRAEGLMEAGGASEEEMEEARAQLAEFDRQMAEMSAEQRQMMQTMMGGKLDSLRRMIESGGLDMEVVVTDLRVNTGPPGNS